MDGQGGDSKQGSVDLDESGCECPILASSDDPSRETQISVQPRMPDTSSVGLHPDLEISFLGPLRDRSDAEVRAIDVSCNDRNPSARLPLLWNGECQQGALVSIRLGVYNQYLVRGSSGSPCKEVFTAFFDIPLPIVYLTDLITER